VSLRDAIEPAMRGEEIPPAILEAAFAEIAAGRASEVEIAALLVALRTKGETQREIVAAARALRASAHSAPCLDPRTLDTCGTGGDGSGTFNISTTAAFIVAGAGVPVAKHGNRAASSRAGSIDVLEALGVAVDLPVDSSARILSEIGIAPFFAARAHPAMRHVAPVRRALGVRTLMNCMGPLLNPLGVRRQLIGVYTRSLVEPLAGALGDLGALRALVVHGSDGLDEITTTGITYAAWLDEGRITRMEIDPRALGIAVPAAGALAGGDAHRNAEILRAVLAGERGACRDVALLNAAAALWVGGVARDLADGLGVAARSLDGGAAQAKLDALVEASHRAVRAA
jgi:anthranilate phosphoribosyltransferase